MPTMVESILNLMHQELKIPVSIGMDDIINVKLTGIDVELFTRKVSSLVEGRESAYLSKISRLEGIAYDIQSVLEDD